jgi:deazaflavin-dependent oxidoreductase (nitroreductase family)
MATKTYQRTAPRRIIDALSSVVARLGMSSRTAVIFTTGRTSGETRSTPVDLTRVDGEVYVVGIYGPKSWVLNLRADPACRVRGKGGETAYTAVELPAAEGAPVLRQYLRESSLVRDYQDVGPDASDEAMEAAAADRPVFRLDAAA